jgi:hypothetical protein
MMNVSHLMWKSVTLRSIRQGPAQGADKNVNIACLKLCFRLNRPSYELAELFYRIL